MLLVQIDLLLNLRPVLYSESDISFRMTADER